MPEKTQMGKLCGTEGQCGCSRGQGVHLGGSFGAVIRNQFTDAIWTLNFLPKQVDAVPGFCAGKVVCADLCNTEIMLAAV